MSDFLTGEVLSIDNLSLPNVLYKYRQFGNTFHEKALFNQDIYIPSANEFNDPYDSRIPFRYKKEDLTPDNIYQKCLSLAKILESGLTEERYQTIAYEMQSKDYLNDVNRLDVFDKQCFNGICHDFGIFCLTPDPVNVLMWSYYGDSHRGFSIGYSTAYLVESGLFGMGGQVFYDDAFPTIPLFYTEADYPILNILLTKWKKWEHENEYRLVHRYNRGKVYNLPQEAISEIVFGSQLSEIEKIQKSEKIRKVLPNTKIFQIELDKYSFELKKVPIFDPNLVVKF